MNEIKYGEAMRAMAKREGHMRSAPRTAVWGLPVGHISKSVRVLKVLKGRGPTHYRVLADEIGISHSSAYDYLRPLVAAGQIQKVGAGTGLYQVAG